MRNNTHNTDEKNNNIHSNNHNDNNNDSTPQPKAKRKALIPLPACCDSPKCKLFRKVLKYTYVIGVICLGFLIAFLTQVSDPIDTWFDSQQHIILDFLIEESALYIILVLLLITALKSIGIKDVLGLRTISVVVLSYKITSDKKAITLLLCMFIIGILSSVSKLIEYQVIGHELQIVQGTPIEFIFKYARKALRLCIKESNLLWLDPKWTFDISLRSRYDKSMHVMANIRDVVQPYLCVKDGETPQNMAQSMNEHVHSDSVAMGDKDGDKWSRFKEFMCAFLYFIVAVFWTSVIEWVQPITELFLFAHNWSLTFRNVIIIVFSEFADIDKAVEAMYLISALYSGGDIIEAKVTVLVSKGIFWALGYCFVAPPSLIWAYLYHKKHAEEFENSNEDEIEKKNNNLELNEFEKVAKTSTSTSYKFKVKNGNAVKI